MLRFTLIIAACVALDWFGAARLAYAQTELAGCKVYTVNTPGGSFDRVTDQLAGILSILTGTAEAPVRIDCDEMQFFADRIEVFHDKSLIVATGHVLFVTTGNRISAERMEFNTTTRNGTFFTASGTVTLGGNVDRSLFGTQEPDAMFYGERIDKIGPTKYRVTHGGFTSCVQPTPRWELVAGTVTLKLDEYALLTNAVFRVKGVPVLYLPVFYYPMEEDDRATGFLLPTYGTSTYRGQTLSNGFFWAINRSQDALFTHDWFTKTGQGFGSEYRYVASPTSDGNARFYMVREHATLDRNGTAIAADKRSYEIRGSARQMLPGKTRLSAYSDYVSDFSVQQLYSQNIYDATRRSSRWGVNATSTFSGFTLNGVYARDQYFYGEENSTITGSRPRISLTRGATQLGPIPAYVNGGVSYGVIQREDVTGSRRVDTGMQKWDGGASLRVPFPKLPYLTVNSSLGWRFTRDARSLDPATGALVDVPLLRQTIDMRTELTGPTLVRIWDRPGSSFAARLKHIVEPTIEFKKQTRVESYSRIIRYDPNDYQLGGSLDTRYALTSRVLVKPAGENAGSRELATFSIQQTHYSVPFNSQYDPSYTTSFRGRPPSHYSPIAISGAFNPAPGSTVSTRIEYDPIADLFQTISVGGGISKGEHVRVSGNFSRRNLLTSVLDPLAAQSENYVDASTTVKNARNTVGGTFNFGYDLSRSTMITQRVMGYYNAQCCGFVMEYQVYNYPPGYPIPQDKRFNISFSLAGIGNFSNFLGAFSGQPTR